MNQTRRDFLKKTTGAALALGAGSAAGAAITEPPDKTPGQKTVERLRAFTERLEKATDGHIFDGLNTMQVKLRVLDEACAYADRDATIQSFSTYPELLGEFQLPVLLRKDFDRLCGTPDLRFCSARNGGEAQIIHLTTHRDSCGYTIGASRAMKYMEQMEAELAGQIKDLLQGRYLSYQRQAVLVPPGGFVARIPGNVMAIHTYADLVLIDHQHEVVRDLLKDPDDVTKFDLYGRTYITDLPLFCGAMWCDPDLIEYKESNTDEEAVS